MSYDGTMKGEVTTYQARYAEQPERHAQRLTSHVPEHAIPREKKRRSHTRRAMARIIAATVAGGVGYFGGIVPTIDTMQTYETEPRDAPSTRIYDENVVSAPNPEIAAKYIPVSPELVEKCRDSRFVVIHFSGTSMETSHYAAAVYNDLVEKYGGCSMFHWAGSRYDDHASAESIEAALEQVTPNGERKTVITIGSSLGGKFAADIMSDPIIADDDDIDFERLVMIATPKDIDDITTSVLGVLPFSMLKYLPEDMEIPKFGKLVVQTQAAIGQIAMGKLQDEQAWRYTLDNASKTRPGLTRSQFEQLRSGMSKFPNVKIYYAGSIVNDTTVNVLQAAQKISEHANVTFVDINARHGDVWEVSAAAVYNPVFERMIKAVIAKQQRKHVATVFE